jgi:hypothetical protein
MDAPSTCVQNFFLTLQKNPTAHSANMSQNPKPLKGKENLGQYQSQNVAEDP